MKKQKNNMMLQNVFNRYFAAMFLSNSVYMIGDLVDSSMSGSFVNLEALAGIGVCSLYLTFYEMILWTFVGGMATLMGFVMGRGEKDKVDVLFSQNMIAMTLFTVVWVAFGLVFADQIVVVLGAHDPIVAGYAATYLRVSSLSVIMSMIISELYRGLLLYGYKRDAYIAEIIYCVMNFSISLYLVKGLSLGVAGLALGTGLSGILMAIYMVIIYMRKENIVRFTLRDLNEFKKNMKETFVLGLPTCINYMTDFVLGVIMNNMVVFTLGTKGLIVYTLFTSLLYLLKVPVWAASDTTSTMSATLYGSRDVSGMKQIIKSNLKMPLLFGTFLSVIMIIFYRPILALFGVTDTTTLSIMLNALLWGLPATVLMLVNGVLIEYYTSIMRVKLATIFSIGADFAIYLVLIFIFLPSGGLNVIWIAYSACYVFLYIIMTTVYCIKYKHLPHSLDDILLLPKDYYDDDNLCEFSLKSDEDKRLKVVETVQNFLGEKGYDARTCYQCALCLEELSVKVIENKPKSMDIRLFTSEGKINISIRDNGAAKNHLLFTAKDEVDGIGIKLVTKAAEKVTYSYMTGFNVLNVVL